MSLATDLTACHARLALAGQNASQEARKLKSVAPVPVMNELLLQLCIIASETNNLRVLLGAMRMTGELEQRPPEVTAETLELGQHVPAFPKHAMRDESAAFKLELEHISDDTFDDYHTSAASVEVSPPGGMR